MVTTFGCGALAANERMTPLSMDDLIGACREFLQLRVANHLKQAGIEGRFELEFRKLDPRLRLACESPVSLRQETPAEPIGRLTLRVSCEGRAPWTIYVPAQVRLYRQVVVASRPLKRQTALLQEDIHLAERDVGLINGGYLTHLDQAKGHQTTRPLLADQPLSPSAIELSDDVKIGDQVVISAGTAAMQVRMPGEALSSGAVGQQIRVRNLRSMRVIRARVTGPAQVQVDL